MKSPGKNGLVRIQIRQTVAILCSTLTVAICAPAQEPEPGEMLFALNVSRLLADKCVACHGKDPKKIKGDLNLTSLEGLLQGGESGESLITPGNAEQSLIYTAVTWKNSDLEMPPKVNDRLTEEQTWQIRDWINAGAPWPNAKIIQSIRERHDQGIRVATSGGLSDDWTNRRYQTENLWAYQPLGHQTANTEGTPDSVDAFINAGLSSAGLEPATMADRRTLIRRATYDLIGLPPAPEEVENFINDPANDEDAFTKVIDRLLANPHYGEHWGRHWLDVVRYADSSGFANDYERGNTWRYRDYVVRAFNEDKPYDQFVTEQIAGDELYDSAPKDTGDTELLIASGFLRMGPWELTGMEVAKVARQRFLDDVTDAVGQVFLGHPMQCARCHDHKFDPIPTRDFYGMQAVFATTQLAERKAQFMDSENVHGFEEREYLEVRKESFQKNLERLNAKEETAARKWAGDRGFDYIPRNKGLRTGIPEDRLAPKKIGFEVEDYGMERISRKGIERLGWELQRFEPFAFSVYSGATPVRDSVKAPLDVPANRMKGELEQTAILTGGDPFSPAEEVQPATLSMLRHFVRDLDESKISDSVSGRRAQLAKWIVHPQNPLTPRVFANRIWLWHFGQGIAGNPNNFGATGKKPSHPGLLDWLAAEFIENGFSIKHLHRVIMMSDTYRRSGDYANRTQLEERDPNGTSYAVFRPRRLAAEELRDSMLAISGELNPAMGGIPNRPEMIREAALQPRMVMGTFAAAWQPNPLPTQRHRRSIYALKIRGLRDPFMEVFDEPSPELSCEARESSTVTPQVFSLFNGQSTYDRAVAAALRFEAETDTDEGAIRRAFHLVYSRQPSTEEIHSCQEHWALMTRRHTEIALTKQKVPKVVVRNAVEENTGEKFSFVEKLEFYEDFIPDKKLADVTPKTRGLAELCLVLFNSNEFAYVY